ncbi:hypothetical protein F7731_04065 [Cytobacillus depressus]|uniref:Uncharacterized protein n=1 Tax=Cytobacillus depressus TaxID=1602942 RepID=A0A6L3VC89_9BACI|nr:hypothetical protein [Cytobacillus depressus]KAB2338732.1 hypothetical protein F7731_04065 [Cytobacillus depressus]
MRKRWNPHTLPPWLRTIRGACCQFIIPFCCFQGIRVILFPTTFDVLFLAILILLAVAFHFEWF